jgi:hypothetical protein
VTIRDYIKRRYWLAIGAGIAGLALTNVVARFSSSPNVVLPVAFVAVIVPILAISWTVRCPNCKRRLGDSIARQIAMPLGSKPPKHCPYCGVSLDEQMPP